MATADVASNEGVGIFLTHGGGGAAVAMRMACSERLLSGGTKSAMSLQSVVRLVVVVAKQYGDAMQAKTWRNKVKQGGRASGVPDSDRYALE